MAYWKYYIFANCFIYCYVDFLFNYLDVTTTTNYFICELMWITLLT